MNMTKKEFIEILLCVMLMASSAGCIPTEVLELAGTNAIDDIAIDSEMHEEAGQAEVDDLSEPEDGTTFVADAVHGEGYERGKILLVGVEYIIMESDVVEIQTEAFGTVNFTPAYYSKGPTCLAFFLEQNGRIVYQLMKERLSWLNFRVDSLTGFYYGDIDMDGLDDIIIIALAQVCTSPSSINSEITVFFQREDGFKNSQAFEGFLQENLGWYEVTTAPNDWHWAAREMWHYRVTCDEILDFVRSQEIDWDQYVT